MKQEIAGISVITASSAGVRGQAEMTLFWTEFCGIDSWISWEVLLCLRTYSIVQNISIVEN